MNWSKLLWPIGVGCGLLAVTVGVGARSASAPIATQVRDDTVLRPLSSPLLKRLAAATDGYRSGAVVWVVISTAEPYSVKGVFPNRLVADSIAVVAGAAWRSIPVQTVADPSAAKFALIKHCYPSILPCFDPLSRLTFTVLPADSVDSVSISIFPHSGPALHSPVNPREVDAIFFNIGSIDKFVIPYYAALQGPESAARLRESITRQLGP